MKIIMTCPNCGNGTWVERVEDGDYIFECLACGELCHQEDMGSRTEETVTEDRIKCLEAKVHRLKVALQEWIDGKCISQKYLTMIGELQQSLAKAKHERALAVDDAAAANNMLKLVYDHLRSCPGMTGGED